MSAEEVYRQEKIRGRENNRDQTSIKKKTDSFIDLFSDVVLNFR